MENSKFLIQKPENYIGTWKAVFKNDNPIEIEIGTGKGKFIIEKAMLNPNINYIGIERYDSVIVRVLEKIPEDLTNLKMIRMNAIDIDKVFKKEIEKIYLNFSDPWPKKRHASRRLTSQLFLKKYDDMFIDSKLICQKTDNRGLFEYSIISLNESGYLIKELSLDLHKSEIPDNITTEYEDKFSQLGEKIYYLKAQKK